MQYIQIHTIHTKYTNNINRIITQIFQYTKTQVSVHFSGIVVAAHCFIKLIALVL